MKREGEKLCTLGVEAAIIRMRLCVVETMPLIQRISRETTQSFEGEEWGGGKNEEEKKGSS